MFIKNAKIYTMDKQGIIENGYLKTENGKFVEIGEMADFDEKNEAVDAGGAYIFPGFIDGHTHIGLSDDSVDDEDYNEMSEPITPEVRVTDAINPFDKTFSEALMSGITTVVVSPGSSNPIAGRISAVKTYGDDISEMLVKEDVGMKFALGENPKHEYADRNVMPFSRMGTAALIRSKLYEAQQYIEKEEPDYDSKLEALKPLLEGETMAFIHAHRADDIMTAIRIMEEFDIKYKLIHATSGYLIADKLAKKGVEILSGPNICERSKPELRDKSFGSDALLSKAGIKFAIITDHDVIPQEFLPLCAAVAVRGGLDEYEALKAITINPAEICGIDNKVGSIAVGKDADFSIFEDLPTDIRVRPRAVFVNGEKVYERA